MSQSDPVIEYESNALTAVLDVAEKGLEAACFGFTRFRLWAWSKALRDMEGVLYRAYEGLRQSRCARCALNRSDRPPSRQTKNPPHTCHLGDRP